MASFVYGGLGCDCRCAFRKDTRAETSSTRSYEGIRKPYRTTYPAPDETSEIARRLSSGDDRSIPTRGQESNSRTTSRFPLKLRRAKEPGRGRHAVAPWQIPWAGWNDIFWRVYASVNDNRLLAVAAGVVFYSLLAIFPAVAAFVSLYGLIADASTIDFASFVGRRRFSLPARSTFFTSRSPGLRQKAKQSSVLDS